MAPEQMRGGAIDARTDLFSLGVMLYELLTGRRPFGGTTTADVTSSILRDLPPPLRTVRVDLPRDLDPHCLAVPGEGRRASLPDRAGRAQRARAGAARGRVGGGSTTGGRQPGRRRRDPSIAVLPFANRSSDPDDEYFSDGLADELLNVLAKVRGLRVAARTSSFTFKGKTATIAEVGRSLNVATVLEGSVRKSGSRARIAVQLIKVSDGYQLWSETYDRSLDDIFAVRTTSPSRW